MSHSHVPMPLLLRGNARTLPLAGASVDLVVTSPPYFGLRDYGHADQLGSEPTPGEFLDTLIECTAEMMRVLKPSGSLFVNLGDKYSSSSGAQSNLTELGRRLGTGGGQKQDSAHRRRRAVAGVPPKSLLLLPERYRIRCVDELGLIARAVVIWSKPNGLPESVTDRVRRSHEDWVHLTKAPRYYSATDEIREATEARPRFMSWEQRRARGDAPRQGEQRGTFGDGMTPNPAGRMPGSVWEIATQPLTVPEHIIHAGCCGGRPATGCTDGVDHYAAYPMAWPRRIIQGWAPPGGTVLDPFAGTNTTALVAAMLGRTGIGVELSGKYAPIAQWRCADPKERARAAGLDPDRVAVIRRQSAGQVDMFDLFEDGAPA